VIEEIYEAPIKVVEGTKKGKPIFEWSDKKLELANLNFNTMISEYVSFYGF